MLALRRPANASQDDEIPSLLASLDALQRYSAYEQMLFIGGVNAEPAVLKYAKRQGFHVVRLCRSQANVFRAFPVLRYVCEVAAALLRIPAVYLTDSHLRKKSYILGGHADLCIEICVLLQASAQCAHSVGHSSGARYISVTLIGWIGGSTKQQ